MKIKKLLKAMLAFALFFNLAFALGMQAEAEEKSTVIDAVVSEDAAKLEAVSGITAKTLFYSTSKEAEYEEYTVAPNGYGFIPVDVENTGLMYLDYFVEGMGDTYYSVRMELVDEENMYRIEAGENYEYYINGAKSFYKDEEYKSVSDIPANKGETYYIFVYNQIPDRTVNIGVKAKLFTTGSRSLSQGTSKWTVFSGRNQDRGVSSTWFKVKPDKTGLMKVDLKEFGESNTYGTVKLYNSDKKVLSNGVLYDSNSKQVAYFGVKKGTTYYLKITDAAGTYKEYNKVGIKYDVTSRTDRSIGSKSKAKTLTRKADSTNTLFTASRSSKTDWYKFKVTSKRKTIVSMNATGMSTGGSLKVTVYCGSKLIGTTYLRAGYKNEFGITNGTTKGKANAGTYYVKVEADSKLSGKYMIRYKE